MNESDDSLQDFFGIRENETFRQEESVISVVAIAAHLESVADWNVVFTQSVVDADSRCSI